MIRLPKYARSATLLVVLSALECGETYGYAIRREAFRKTKGMFTVNEGALYPLLGVLTRRGMVRVRQVKVKGRWRKHYRLTERGHMELSRVRAEWKASLRLLQALVG